MAQQIPSDTHVDDDPNHTPDHNNMADMFGLLVQMLAQAVGVFNTPPAGNSANVSALQAFVTNTSSFNGLKYLTGGGTITTAALTAASAAGYQGVFLDPQYVWDMTGVSFAGISNFKVKSEMKGSIGWTGNVAYRTTGYIKTDTATPADGVQIFGNVGSECQGIVFENLSFVGGNTNSVVHCGGRQRMFKMIDCFVYNTNSTNTTVAAGSNGVDVSTFAGAGTLNVASATSFPSSGNVITATTTNSQSTLAIISYTGKSSTTLTGCTTLGGSGTLATGGGAWLAAFGLIDDAGIQNFNSENQMFRGLQVAGQNCCVGIGVNDLGQHANDTSWYDLVTSCVSGPVSLVDVQGSNHNFHLYYDRSAGGGATVTSVCNMGGVINFWGGEDQNSGSAGVAQMVIGNAISTTVNSRTVTQVTATNTLVVTAGSLIARGRTRWGGTCSLTGTGNLDLNDPAGSYSSLTVDGTGGSGSASLMLAGSYNPGSAPIVAAAYTGKIIYQAPAVVATKSATGQTTTQSLTWTPPPRNCAFRVSVLVHPTVAGTSTVASISFTERGPSSRSYNIPMLRQDGTSTAFQFLNAAADSFLGQVCSQTDNSATNVVVTVTPTGSTFRYSIAIELLATA